MLLVNAKLYQEWQKAQQTGKSPDALAAEQSGLPDDFFQKMFTATPSLVDQQAYADAAQEVKDEAGLKGKLANTPKEKTFTWQEAAEAVVASFAAFHPEMGEIATRAFTENWIDGRNIPDKLHNNYSHYQQTSKTHAPMHPYISVHFDGSLKSVRALAHELGHAAADYLSGEETGNPISGSALHETYAHFAEALLMEHLVSSAKDPLEKADFRMSQFDRAMVAIVQSGMGALESMLYQATADETGHTPSLSAKEITGLMREAMHGVASPEALAKIPDLALLKQLGRYSQILVHDAFYNSSYPLAEMAAMHMAKEFKELGDSGKAEYADHWVKTMKLGSMLNYGRGMDAMGMNIGEPEALVVEAKETITGYMRELTAYVIEAEKPKWFAKRIDASREANAQHTR